MVSLVAFITSNSVADWFVCFWLWELQSCGFVGLCECVFCGLTMLQQFVLFLVGAALLFSSAWAREDANDDLLEMAVAIFKDNRMYMSEFESQVVPTGMNYGSWYQVSVMFRNIGTMPWIPGDVRLVNAVGSNFGVSEVPLAHEVGPGGVANFAFSIKSECGSWLPFPYFLCADPEPDFTWAMASSSGGFGPPSPKLRNIYQGNTQPPSGGGNTLPRQPTVPMIDQEIPFSPPPKDPPAPYPVADQWKEIKW